MPDLLWLLSVALLLMFLVMVGFSITLLVLLWKMFRTQQQLPLSLLTDQQTENQLLRNQLLAFGDPERVAHLNYATLPSTKLAAQGSDPVDMTDLGEAINYEEGLARKGYSIGDLDHGLESSGWSPAVIKRDGSDPIAF